MANEQQGQDAAAVKTGEDLLTAGAGQKGDAGGGAAQGGQALFFHQPVQLVHDLAQGAPAVHQAPLGVDHAPAQGSRLLAVSQLLHIPQIDGLPIDGYAVPAQGFELDPVSPELGGGSGTAAETGGGSRLHDGAPGGEGPGLLLGGGGDVPGDIPVHLDDAVGGVEEGDETDNAQYYCEEARKAAEQAAGSVGFDGTASSVSAVDTHNLTGAGAGKKSTVQALLDKIAQKLIEKGVTSDTFQTVLAKYLVNNGLTTEAGKFGLDAAFGKNLQDQITQQNSNIEAIKNGLTAVQFTGDINDLRNQSLNMNTQKVYLISKDTVQNIPDAMIGTGLLTIKNMGLFASIEIVDSNKQQYIWGGWNSESITSLSWK